MLYRGIIAVCSQIHTKHINTLWVQDTELPAELQTLWVQDTELPAELHTLWVQDTELPAELHTLSVSVSVPNSQFVSVAEAASRLKLFR
jgi:hypothetical protein